MECFKSSQEAVPKTKVTAELCLPWLSHCYGVPTQVFQPSAARRDPIHGGTEPGLCTWGERPEWGSKKHHLVREDYLPSPGQENIREEKPSVVSFSITFTPATFLLLWPCILVHRWAIAQREAFARAVFEEQKCSQGFKDVLGHCSAWSLRRHAAVKCVFSWQALARMERKRWGLREKWDQLKYRS